MLAVMGVLALLVLGSAAIIRHLIPDPDAVSGTVLSPAVKWALSLSPPAWLDEADAARRTNYAMRQWFVTCKLASFDANDNVSADTDKLFFQYRAIGDALFFERIALARAADSSFTVLETATMASIFIGLLTTVFAGLRSDEQTLGGWKPIVSVLAIVFPALGTAVAALAAFYGPREQLLQLSQSLTPLQQLHTDMRIGLTRTPCPATLEEYRKVQEQLVSWEERHIKQGPETSVARLAAIAKTAGPAAGPTGLGH